MARASRRVTLSASSSGSSAASGRRRTVASGSGSRSGANWPAAWAGISFSRVQAPARRSSRRSAPMTRAPTPSGAPESQHAPNRSLTGSRSAPDTIVDMLSVPLQLGYPALFGLVFAESAGVPVPGETALLTAGVLAGAGPLALPFVVVVAVAAAVTGDTLGYWLGRRGGRAVLTRGGPLAGLRSQTLDTGER